MSLLRWTLLVPGMKPLFRAIFSAKLPVKVAGLDLPNPVGLGAGFDKNAQFLHLLPYLGFGSVEIGTVTPRPQGGNPKPRLFRLPASNALINRMGFNNDGVEIIAKRLRNRPPGLIVGGNIGKNKKTPNVDARNDYGECLTTLHPLVDYFTVNVSSPNTPGLRELQDKGPLLDLLKYLQEMNSTMGQKPIFLKIAPDLTREQIDDVVDVVVAAEIAGVIATNTTLDRQVAASDQQAAKEDGGLSGKPLTAKAAELTNYLCDKARSRFDVIASGGIMSVADAKARMDAGASAVQVWTGFVYEGPGLVKRIVKGLK